MTYSYTTDYTFTRTNAEYIASKVAADLRGMRSYYGQPSESWIWAFYQEVVELLVESCLRSVEYGFKRNGRRVITLKYEVRADGSLLDGRSGGVYARANISNAAWFSFLTYSDKWYLLSDADQQRIKKRLPFKRVSGKEPQDGDGYWVDDRSYSSRGVGAQRWTFRSR